MECDVTVQLDGNDVLVGHLFQNVRHGNETASFTYAASYLQDARAFALAPDMPLGGGSFHSSGLKDFRVFEDCMPDRWGRNLMLRAERTRAKSESRVARTLFEMDMLTGANDESRQGALRFWDDHGVALAPSQEGVPREVSIPTLLDAADGIARDMDADVKDLLEAGSSLGGARPKASVRDERGNLYIAKFPKMNENSLSDVSAWERTAMQLMDKCGISVPSTRMLRVRGRSVLLTQRFDRNGEKRIPYISGLTAIQGRDGESYSYLELAEFIEEEGARPDADLRELWCRALFSCAIGNIDNHMRNYGFLRRENGWALSPAFDVNPTPGDEVKYLNTGLGFDSREADPRLAVQMCEYFRLTVPEAKHLAKGMAKTLVGWARIARGNGISEESIHMMANCFESGIRRLEQASM